MREQKKRKSKAQKERERWERLGLPDPYLKAIEIALKQLQGFYREELEAEKSRENGKQ